MNLTGSVPEVISSAIRLASLDVTPLISLPPVSVASIPFGYCWKSTLGAATSLLSTTIAFRRLRCAATPSWAIWRVMSVKSWSPPFLYESETIGWPLLGSTSALALEISSPVMICESWVGVRKRYQTVPAVVASGQPAVAAQLTACVPLGTGSQIVPAGFTLRWMSSRTWSCFGSIRDVTPLALTRLWGALAAKSAQPAGVPVGICCLAAFSIS